MGRRDGVKFLFRFAYETDMSRTKGPSLARILSHIRELSAIVKRNADVIYAFQVGKVGAHVPVDGELFWIGNVDPARQNGLDALIRLRRHHYTTFSLVHGNSELDMNSGRDIGPIDTWKKTPVTADLLASFGIPSDPAYFADVPYRTAYEYIRDHLGYRLVAKDVKWTDGTARVTLHNYGFAAPINPRKAVFVVLAADGTVTECPTGFDCRRMAPESDTIVSSGAIPNRKVGDRLALWLPDEMPSIRLRPEYAIRLAGGVTVETIGGRLLNVLDR